MKYLCLLALTCILAACATGPQVDSIGVGATYTDPDGAEYGGNVNVHLKDRSKVVKPIQSAQLVRPQPSFFTCLGVGLARLADGPHPDPRQGPSLEQTIFGQKAP